MSGASDVAMAHQRMPSISIASSFFSQREPWQLVKSDAPTDQDRLRAILYATMETLRVCATVLLPIIPSVRWDFFMRALAHAAQLAGIILDRLGVPGSNRSWEWTLQPLPHSCACDSSSAPLFVLAKGEEAGQVKPSTPSKKVPRKSTS